MKKLIVGLLAAFLMTTGLVAFSSSPSSAAPADCPYSGCAATNTVGVGVGGRLVDDGDGDVPPRQPAPHRRHLGAGQIERGDRLIDLSERISLLPQVDDVLVGSIELRELLDCGRGSREGSRLVEHEPAEQGVEGAEVLR